ncbi:hypothetical protein IQ276_033275 [Desmonostoc muscorum LEGE 12446]|nr:hypothetical protein [Desmonostoc muscorum]MCF2151204.1 hypothetical protein [Desmonostoc muscorum LEGE 12446]
MSDLIYPTLDLFAYNLGEGLGDNQDDIKKRRNQFLALMPKNIQDILIPAFDKESALQNPEYIELLKIAGQISTFHDFPTKEINNYKLQGYYYPVRLKDTYGLLFDCSVDEKDNPQKLSCLRYLKQQAHSIKADLGKTWIISGIAPSHNTDTENLAKNIYKNLMIEEKSPNLTDADYESLISQEWQYRKAGKFLNASVFEIWQMPNNWVNIEDGNHVLVFLYPNQQSMQDATKFYKDWMHLFCYRNKIIWAYSETRKIQKLLKNGFKTIRETINLVSKKSDLQGLKAILEKNIENYYKYVIDLNNLDILSKTIEVNWLNYKEYIKYINNYINENSGKFGDTDLKFLEDINSIIQEKYQAQVRQDYDSLRPGIEILETLLNTIRGMVEIEQAQRDRNLNNTVAIAGVGLATSQIASSIIIAQEPPPDNTPFFKTTAFVWSVGTGVVASVILWSILRLYRLMTRIHS